MRYTALAMLMMTACSKNSGDPSDAAKQVYTDSIKALGCELEDVKAGADPHREADLAAKTGDRRFLGINGITLLVSTHRIGQLDFDRTYGELVRRNGIRAIEGTSDVYGSDRRCFQLGSYEYTKHYNERMIELSGLADK